MKKLLCYAISFATFAAALPLARADVISDHQGRWMGEMKVPHNGPTLKIGADLFLRSDGSPWASFASPDQGVYDVPVSRIDQSADKLELTLPFGLLKMRWEQDHFTGEYRQNGTAEWLPITFQPVAQFPMRQRPQTPKAPFPYQEQTLAIPGAGGVTLGATLTLPDGQDTPTLAILVNGSGPATRDEEFAEHRPFAVLADYLARQGIAVLRYDKRGIGRSTGDYENHTQTELAQDLEALLLAMKARGQFARIGLVGHSEGSVLAAAVAARQPEALAFLVSLAGPGQPGVQAMLLQDRAYARDQKARGPDLERLMRYVRQYYDTIVAEPEAAPRIAALKALQDRLPAADKALIKKYRMNVGTLSLEWAAKPFVRAILLSDPAADWRRVRCPVLILNGELDHQVPAAANLGGIVAALRKGGNRKIEFARLPSLNHMFQTTKTGREDEYASNEETIAPAVMQRVARFVSVQR